jgi:hypothetical protein
MATRVTRRRITAPVSARTAKKRAARRQQSEIAKKQNVANAAKQPETLTQARTWDRKYKRYLVAGLCGSCASNAAWGHALGFGKIPDPCAKCQPIVSEFATDGPRGSKWRKVLEKLERSVPEETITKLMCA